MRSQSGSFSLWSEPKATWQLAMTVLVVTAGTNFQIFSSSVVNNVQIVVESWMNETFQIRYGYSLTTSSSTILWSVASCGPQLGGLVGSIFTGLVAETVGRRRGLMISSIASIVGSVMVGLAKEAESYEMIVVGRIFLGLGMGLGFGLAGMFLTEIPAVRHRGISGTFQQVFVGFGDFFSLAITLPIFLGTEYLWPIAFAVPLVPSSVQLVYLVLFAHETPRFLYLSRGQTAEAERAIEFYQGSGGLEETLKDLQMEKEGRAKVAQRKVKILDLVKVRELRKPFLIALTVMVTMVMSGIGAVMTFSTDMFIAAGLDTDVAQYATVGVGFCNFFVPLFVLCLIEKVGRRILYLTMLWGDFVSLTLLSLFVGLNYYDHYSWTEIPTIVCLVSFQIFFGIGAPVGWMITSELFETHIRSMAVSVISPFYWGVSALWIFLYLPFKSAVGITFSFTPFLVCLLFGIFYLTKRLPETKGKTIETISAGFHKKNLPEVFTVDLARPPHKQGANGVTH